VSICSQGRSGPFPAPKLWLLRIPTLCCGLTKCWAVRDGRWGSFLPLDATVFLGFWLLTCAGAYTTARTTAQRKKVFELTFHVERLATSARLMLEAEVRCSICATPESARVHETPGLVTSRPLVKGCHSQSHSGSVCPPPVPRGMPDNRTQLSETPHAAGLCMVWHTRPTAHQRCRRLARSGEATGQVRRRLRRSSRSSRTRGCCGRGC
jgi:hypothetical protein